MLGLFVRSLRLQKYSLTQLDSSKPAIRDHPDEIYGLYGQFYDDFDFKFGEPHSSGGLPSYESAVKIEAKFLTFNLGLTRPGIRVFALEGEFSVVNHCFLWLGLRTISKYTLLNIFCLIFQTRQRHIISQRDVLMSIQVQV
jgi:hypothetical protein